MNTKQKFFCVLIFALVGLFFFGCHDDYRYGARADKYNTDGTGDEVGDPTIVCEADETQTFSTSGLWPVVVSDGQGFLMAWLHEDRESLVIAPFDKKGEALLESQRIHGPHPLYWSMSPLVSKRGYNLFLHGPSNEPLIYMELNGNAETISRKTTPVHNNTPTPYLASGWQSGDWLMYQIRDADNQHFIPILLAHIGGENILEESRVIDNGQVSLLDMENNGQNGLLYALQRRAGTDANEEDLYTLEVNLFIPEENRILPVLQTPPSQNQVYVKDIVLLANNIGYAVEIVAYRQGQMISDEVVFVTPTGKITSSWNTEDGDTIDQIVPLFEGVGVLSSDTLGHHEVTLSIIDTKGKLIGGPFPTGIINSQSSNSQLAFNHEQLTSSSDGTVMIALYGTMSGVQLKRIVCTKQ